MNNDKAMQAREGERRPWRTNVGLRLTAKLGLWFDKKCEEENRAYSNYVELLILKEYRAETLKQGIPHDK